MQFSVENAKLLATLLAVIQKENSKTKDSLYEQLYACLLYTSPSPRDRTRSRMPSSA